METHGIAREQKVPLSETEQRRRAKQLQQYKKLLLQVRQKYANKEYTVEALHLTSALLSENPEYYSIWNYRRRILDSVFHNELPPESVPHIVDVSDEGVSAKCTLTPTQHEISLLINEDLRFLLPLQQANPKNYWMWNHRLWLLGRTSEYLPTALAIQMWASELALATKMLNRDDRNFHGWDYRRGIITALEHLRAQMTPANSDNRIEEEQSLEAVQESRRISSEQQRIALAKEEFNYSDRMVRSNLSNYSAWHYRLRQMRKILDMSNASDTERRQMFEKEINFVTEALWISTTPADQSLWFYHQQLCSTLDPDAKTKFVILRNVDMDQRREYIAKQISAVREVKEDNEELKWVYQALADLSGLYLKIGGTVDVGEMMTWMDKLHNLDPLRQARWTDVAISMAV